MPTKISWSDETWNTVDGCSMVSSGCRFCYAERISRARGGIHFPWTKRYEGHNVKMRPDRLDIPRKWKRRRKVFVNSMSDLFHDQVADWFIKKVFATMRACPQHVFMVLTKRPARMREWCETYQQHPLENVWLGVSVENQQAAEARIWTLLETPAATRFISYEPALGPVTLFGAWLHSLGHNNPVYDLPRLDWVIMGGETGPDHRPMDIDWARDVRDQCRMERVPFYFKQFHGPRQADEPPELDGYVWAEYPKLPALPVAVEQLRLGL